MTMYSYDECQYFECRYVENTYAECSMCSNFFISPSCKKFTNVK